MSVSQDTLIRFVYGELSADEARDVVLALENDPALRALVEEQRKVRSELESTHAAQSDAEPGSAPIRPTIAVWPRAMRGRNLAAGLAMLAGLGLGVLLAGSLGLGSDIAYERGGLIAGGTLAAALTTQLSNAPQSGITVLSSFWSTRESFCRSFVAIARGSHGLAGIACREGGAWHILATADIAPPQDGVDAEPGLPSSIRAVAAAIIAGEPLNDEAERTARGQDWRPR
jgi:hypothetical protein